MQRSALVFRSEPECEPRLRRDREPDYAGLQSIVSATVARTFDIPLDVLQGPSRGVARVALARQAAMYLLHVEGGIDYAMVGRFFGRDRTTVKHACAVVEDRRDDAGFDLLIENMRGIVEHYLKLASGIPSPAND